MTHASGLPTKQHSNVEESMFLRPRRPQDHAEFEWLLPQCTPLYVYADEDGDEWVRWSIPMEVAQRLGISGGCACCGDNTTVGDEHHVEIDTAWREVDWWFYGRN